MKVKKLWIYTDEDVNVMYDKHKGKGSILLWGYSSMKQAGRNKATASIPSHSDEGDEETGVDKYFEASKKKRGDGKYTLEQLRMWAHLIQMGKHSSTDEPPDKPFWQGRKRKHINLL